MKHFGIFTATLICTVLLLASCTSGAHHKAGASSSTTSSIKTSRALQNPVERIVPTNMQGNWYAMMDDGSLIKLTFTPSTMTASGADGGTAIFHKTGSNPSQVPAPVQKKWVRGTMTTIRHIRYLNMHAWDQTTGPGSFYGVTTETYNGQPTTVLVEGQGTTAQTAILYYRTAAQARQMRGVTFDADSRLNYQN